MWEAAKAFPIGKLPDLLAKVSKPAGRGKVRAGFGRNEAARVGREESGMNGLRRFFREETATAEATSIVIMIAAVGILLAAGLAIWYNSLNSSFNTMANSVNTLTNVIPSGS
jgi:hypothetical protein